MRRPLRYLLALGAFAVLLAGLSACATFKPESLAVTQPAGLGAVRIHFVLCSDYENLTPSKPCEGSSEEGEVQSSLAIVMPKGSVAPNTITAPASSGPTLVYRRNQQVADQYAARQEEIEAESAEEVEPFVPPGYEIAGYLSDPYEEVKEEGEGEHREWTIDADFGLPSPAGDLPYAGEFKTDIGVGWRVVTPERPADRPYECRELEGSGLETQVYAYCLVNQETGQAAVTDLRVAGAPAVAAPVGGKATLDFPLAAASTASPGPGFNLTAATSIPGGSATPVEPTYNPAYDSTTHQGTPATRAVAVTMPPTTPPGTYTVTLAAHAAAGGTVANSGQIVVGQLSLGLGKAKRNLKKGTATVSVQVPAAGTLLVSGKGVAKVTKSAPAAGTLKLTVRAKGKAKKQLKKKGKVRVKPNFVFSPANGAPVARPRPLILRVAG